MCSTCAPRVQHVCTTCAPRVHLYFTGISEQWSGQGFLYYSEVIIYLSLQAQIQDVRENTGAHVVHTWCTRGAHALHTCCTRGSSVGRQCVDVGAVGSGAERQTEVSRWLSDDVDALKLPTGDGPAELRQHLENRSPSSPLSLWS